MIPMLNLLPYHADRRQQRRQRVYYGLLASALIGGLMLGLWGMVMEGRIHRQQAWNALLVAENARLDAQIREVNTVKQDIENLQIRQNVVEQLQAERGQAVRLMEALVQWVPEGVYLKTLRQSGADFTVEGMSRSNDHVSLLLRQLSEVSWLEHAELLETRSVVTGEAASGGRRLYAFSLHFSYRKVEGDALATSHQPGKTAWP